MAGAAGSFGSARPTPAPAKPPAPGSALELVPAPGLLSQADEGPNSRDRVYTVRRTFFGFLYQVHTPTEAGWPVYGPRTPANPFRSFFVSQRRVRADEKQNLINLISNKNHRNQP